MDHLDSALLAPAVATFEVTSTGVTLQLENAAGNNEATEELLRIGHILMPELQVALCAGQLATVATKGRFSMELAMRLDPDPATAATSTKVYEEAPFLLASPPNTEATPAATPLAVQPLDQQAAPPVEHSSRVSKKVASRIEHSSGIEIKAWWGSTAAAERAASPDSKSVSPAPGSPPTLLAARSIRELGSATELSAGKPFTSTSGTRDNTNKPDRTCSIKAQQKKKRRSCCQAAKSFMRAFAKALTPACSRKPAAIH